MTLAECNGTINTTEGRPGLAWLALVKRAVTRSEPGRTGRSGWC
jgi:hypothetical protein